MRKPKKRLKGKKFQGEEENRKRQDTEDRKQGKLGAKQMRTDERQPSSHKRKAEDTLEDERDRARSSGEGAVPMEDENDEAKQASSSSGGVDVDAVWRTKHGTIWDMRHNGKWDFSRVEDRNSAKRNMHQLQG